MKKSSKSLNKSLRINYAIALHDDAEKKRVNAVLDEHRTIMGPEIQAFEEGVAEQFGKKYGIMVNSGSSGNLTAIELLDLPEGSEVITPLLTFSTVVAPLLQKRLVPVFADVEPGTYNINVDQIEDLITDKTRALMIPLLLGNVPDLERIRMIAEKHGLYFIEDSCDTLGATFNGKPSGTYSDISVTSFYGSHIITAGGGGGMVMVNNPQWKATAQMLRGWGRSSSVFDESESIDMRFGHKVDGVQYDAKFIFGLQGYNFLPLEMGAAFGNAQLEKLPTFRKTRERNFAKLLSFFKGYEEYFITPVQDERVATQWLAFPLTIREDAPFTRLQLQTFLEEHNVQTRPIFTGNILKQPAFKDIPHRIHPDGYTVTNDIMKRGIVFGCHHGLEQKHIDKLKDLFTAFIEMKTE